MFHASVHARLEATANTDAGLGKGTELPALGPCEVGVTTLRPHYFKNTYTKPGWGAGWGWVHVA